MPIGEPYIQAICDKCDEVSDGMPLTALAGDGWDARNVPGVLKRWDWKVDGEVTLCPDCKEPSSSAA